MDETGVLGLLEELSILLEDSKPVFGKNNLRQVDIAAEMCIRDSIIGRRGLAVAVECRHRKAAR